MWKRNKEFEAKAMQKARKREAKKVGKKTQIDKADEPRSDGGK